MKILNLYAGIGGNRKLWDKEHTGLDLEITTVELNPQIAKIYQDFFPNDKVVIADAHPYLLEHYQEYDFIWSSITCTTHSQLYWLRVLSDSKVTGAYLTKAKYPDMKLYEEVLMLRYYCQTKWVVENTIPFYPPLVEGLKTGGHIWWSNFEIIPIEHGTRGHRGGW